MRIQMTQVIGRETAFSKRLAHRAHCAFARRLGRRHVVRVARRAKTGHFRQNIRTTRHGVLKRFEHQCARTLARNKTAAIHVERHRCRCRIGRFRGRAQIAEARQAYGRNGFFAATRERHIGIAMANKAIRLAHAMRARRACRHNREAIGFQPEANG